ncbi:asparaginase [Glycomyces sp. L485]|uniref:asparaginase n=1 Tax=Glycomyces sp. L485 TaxID=2909235 RepID=UPI001F4B4F8D|nr:asparaginase [Glycomyces sp. L485]MCH7229715.1 asparaginase [Glycomyces sp. L485]
MTSAYRGGEPVAELVRSGFAESFHRGSVAVTDPDGRVLASIGDVTAPVFARSSAKPLQALAMMRAGWKPDTDADLAIASASHKGEPMHIAQVDSVLRHAGLGEDQLQCPPDLPGDPASRRAVIAMGGGARRVYMSCSGKHSAMLATCAANDWDPATYREPLHPLQEQISATVEEMCGEPVAATGVDGCGAPVLAVPLRGLAVAYARLVAAKAGTMERTVADAMRAHPRLVDGTEGSDSRSMLAVPGLLAKVGAEGLHAVAVPGVGAVAVKIDDGAGRASMPVALRALQTMAGYTFPEEAQTMIEELVWPEVYGGGMPVGRLRTLL